LQKEVQVYAEVLVKKPTQAFAAIRRTITEGGALSFEEGMEIEYVCAVDLAGTRNFTEGIQAFLEK
jgi:enoyl-CoA hydratase